MSAFTKSKVQKRPIFLPTHSCYDDCMRFLLTFNEPKIRRTSSIVHAICQPPGTNTSYAHAWAEFDDKEKGRLAIQGLLFEGAFVYVGVPVDEYRLAQGVVDETRYTFTEALVHGGKHDTSGPWLQKYRDQTIEGRGLEERKAFGAIKFKTGVFINEPPEFVNKSIEQLFATDIHSRFLACLFAMGTERAAEVIRELQEVPEDQWPDLQTLSKHLKDSSAS